MRGWVKAVAKHSKMDAERFSAHSLRKTGATTAFDLGNSIADVEYSGGWAQDSKSLRGCYLQSSKVRVAQRVFGSKQA